MKLKRIATALLVATLATAGTAAFADSPNASSANETTSFASEFPGIVTYADLHRNDAVQVASSPVPSSANETTSFASEFPGIVTYADLHRNDAVQLASSPFPSSANETTSMADEGLVPGLNSGTNAYAGVAQPVHN